MGERFAAAALALLVLACGPPAGQLHVITLSTPDGEHPLPVRLGDTSERIVSIEPELFDGAAANDPSVRGVAGKPNAFVLSWIGGMCDSDVVINFWPEEDGFGLQLHTNAKPGLGCPAAGIGRAIQIELSEPVSVDDITLVPGA